MAAAFIVEESPGSTEKRWRVITAWGNPRESATENNRPTCKNCLAEEISADGFILVW